MLAVVTSNRFVLEARHVRQLADLKTVARRQHTSQSRFSSSLMMGAKMARAESFQVDPDLPLDLGSALLRSPPWIPVLVRSTPAPFGC